MVEDFDTGIGKILTKLKDEGIEENTLVIFFSDNGPTNKGNTANLRGYKGNVFEGGIRVPFVARWPQTLKQNTVSSQVFISMDITASLLNIVGAKSERKLDGIDLLETVASQTPNFDRTLFWRKRRGDTTNNAVRKGDLKYIQTVKGDDVEEHLFDLKEDPSESKDLRSSRPGDLIEMKDLLVQWDKEVKAERYEP